MKKRSLLLIVILVCGAVVGLVFAGKAIFDGESKSEIDSLIDYTKGDQAADAQHEQKAPERLRFSNVDLSKAFDYYYPNRGKEGKITYTIDEPGLVSILITKAGTRELYLAKIVHWDYRDAGTHTEVWDGKDYSGNIIKPSEARLTVQGEKMSSYAPGTMSLKDMTDEEIVHGHEWGHVHATHHAEAEETPILTIASISDSAVLSGKVLIKTSVDKDKRGYGDKYGYGVRYYIDNVLAHEEFYRPESNGEFAYELDTTAFEDGEYTLYVGMCDHNQHATSASVKVKISNSEL